MVSHTKRLSSLIAATGSSYGNQNGYVRLASTERGRRVTLKVDWELLLHSQHLIRPTGMWEVPKMQEQLFGRPTGMWEVPKMQEQLFGRPTGMWEVPKMQEQLFGRPTGMWEVLVLQEQIPAVHVGHALIAYPPYVINSIGEGMAEYLVRKLYISNNTSPLTITGATSIFSGDAEKLLAGRQVLFAVLLIELHK